MTGQRATWTPYLDDGRTLDHGRAVDLADYLVQGTLIVGTDAYMPADMAPAQAEEILAGLRRTRRPGFSAAEAREQYEQGVVFPQPEWPVTLDSMFPFITIWQEVDRPRYRDGHRVIDGEVAEPGAVQPSRSEPVDGRFVL